ncbi:hypothetical protein B0H14DRAFT_2606605 [Mycena olivaceomarginata]|nr:hypothetical protein B0H14DRAFT_2606605 [Mycena olivaceomarginata]
MTGVRTVLDDFFFTHAAAVDNELPIPANTPFVLHTNNALAEAAQFSSAGGSALTQRACDSYFDRPEVLKAYRERTEIETPDFENLSETLSSVGGPRCPVPSTEHTIADLDAVYEKRHRKYEKFEKRQRLREKEKLKHAQHTLKHRIQELQGIDYSAFMAAPASAFPAPEADPILSGLRSTAAVEGERRRKEMVVNALELEQHYCTLLRDCKPSPERPLKQGNARKRHKTEDNVVPLKSPSASEQVSKSAKQKPTLCASSILPFREELPNPEKVPPALRTHHLVGGIFARALVTREEGRGQTENIGELGGGFLARE